MKLKTYFKENCFGALSDQCVEKRIFHRLMSGLQASISTHIAMEYFFGGLTDRDSPDQWGINMPLFVRSVGSHPDRLNNLYFTFLFVLRAVAKAEYLLSTYPYHTGNVTEDREVSNMMKALVSGNALSPDLKVPESNSASTSTYANANFLSNEIKCRNAFDESILFQNSPAVQDHTYFPGEITPVYELKQEFKLRLDASLQIIETSLTSTTNMRFRFRFRNISRIMDCVTCEKCKVRLQDYIRERTRLYS